LKETKQSLTIIDYTFTNITKNQSNQDHRVDTVYRGNGIKALAIMQVEESNRPIDLLNECEKININGLVVLP
jgi:hypothetical protein